jgi:hypothetical protein
MAQAEITLLADPPDHVKVGLENRWRMYLAEAGWMVYCEWQYDRYLNNKWRLFWATHENYPLQRAVTMEELVKRCDWSIAYRMPRKARKLVFGKRP